MKVEGYFFGVIALFLAASDTVYWLMSKDPTGTAALTLAFGLAALSATYLLFTSRHIPPRPEDRGDADVAEGSGEVGHFSPRSYWPFTMGLGSMGVMLGAIFGIWLAIIGVAVLVIGLVGLLFENVIGRTEPRV